MYNYLNKGTSTPLAILIILCLASLVANITWMEFLAMQKEGRSETEVVLASKEFCRPSLNLCDGKKVSLKGSIASLIRECVVIPELADKYKEYVYSEYLDLTEGRQVMLYSKENISCESILKVEGVLKKIEIECELG